MIVILKKDPDQRQLDSLKTWLKAKGIDVHESTGIHQTILGLIGDTTTIDINLLNALEIVEDVQYSALSAIPPRST